MSDAKIIWVWNGSTLTESDGVLPAVGDFLVHMREYAALAQELATVKAERDRIVGHVGGWNREQDTIGYWYSMNSWAREENKRLAAELESERGVRNHCLAALERIANLPTHVVGNSVPISVPISIARNAIERYCFQPPSVP